jgi:DNA-binding PadR family transcriptional regulator
MKPGTTTYALLALLDVQPWASYELTKQAKRSLRYLWPSSEANLYREQRRLVARGWAKVSEEPRGARRRTVYSITRTGRAELRRWIRTQPQAPALEVEAALRVFFADSGTPGDLIESMRATAADCSNVVQELGAFAAEYLQTGGPFPERLHLISLAMDLLVRAHEEIGAACLDIAEEAKRWSSTSAVGMTPRVRARLERIAAARPR